MYIVTHHLEMSICVSFKKIKLKKWIRNNISTCSPTSPQLGAFLLKMKKQLNSDSHYIGAKKGYREEVQSMEEVLHKCSTSSYTSSINQYFLDTTMSTNTSIWIPPTFPVFDYYIDPIILDINGLILVTYRNINILLENSKYISLFVAFIYKLSTFVMAF